MFRREVPTPVRAAILLMSLLPLGGIPACSPPTGTDVIGDTPAPVVPTVGPYLGLTANCADAYPESLGTALDMARETGVTLLTHTLGWSDVEASGGAIDWYAAASVLGSFRGQRFATFLCLSFVDTRMRHVPADLAALDWNDAAMLQRADRMVDSLAWLPRQEQVVAVALGRDGDAYFETHAGEFTSFLALYRRAVQRLHARAPDIPVGIGTRCPVGNPLAHYGDSLNVTSDVVVHSLYPATTGSLQMETPAELLFANWHQFTDVSASGLRYYSTYHGGFVPEEWAFHGSLGLRDSIGRPKAAWSAWRGR